MKKDAREDLRSIGRVRGWRLCETVGAGYALVREGRTIVWSRSGRGSCTVTWSRFPHVRVPGEAFVDCSPALRSREAFAVEILTAYSDARFLEYARSHLVTNLEAARRLAADAQSALEEFDAASLALAKEHTNG